MCYSREERVPYLATLISRYGSGFAGSSSDVSRISERKKKICNRCTVTSEKVHTYAHAHAHAYSSAETVVHTVQSAFYRRSTRISAGSDPVRNWLHDGRDSVDVCGGLVRLDWGFVARTGIQAVYRIGGTLP